MVTDTPLADIAKTIAGHFVAAEIRVFRSADVESADDWISQQLSIPGEYS